MSLSKKYQDKADAVLSLCDNLTVDFDLIIQQKYTHEVFNDSDIRKIELFAKLVHLRDLEPKFEQYLISKTASNHLAHHKDSRDPLHYALDLIIGWLSEDIMFYFLESNGISLKYFGKDQQREILTSRDVSADSDFVISTKDTDFQLELMIDWNNYWRRYNVCNVRASKIDKLIDCSGIFLGVDAHTGHCIFSHFDTEIDHGWEFEKSHKPFGGKAVWSLKGVSTTSKSKEQVVNELLSL